MNADSFAAGSIIDRGYQRYDGERRGLAHAVWTMVKASMQRGMGIRRPFRAKILPWLLVIIVYLPVIFFLAVHIFLQNSGSNLFTPSASSYAGFYGLVALPVIVFAGLLAPDLLCPDRRERVLSLYFVAPITRLHYLLAKFAAVAILLLLITLIPALLFFFGSAFLETDALGFIGAHFGDLGHVILSGLLVALYYGAVATAVAAFHDRRAYAAGTYIGLLLVSGVAGGIISNSLHFDHHEWFALIDLLNLPLQTLSWLFNQPLTGHLDGWAYLGATLAVIIASGALVINQYLRLSKV